MLNKVLKSVLKIVTVLVPLVLEVASIFEKDDKFSMRDDKELEDA